MMLITPAIAGTIECDAALSVADTLDLARQYGEVGAAGHVPRHSLPSTRMRMYLRHAVQRSEPMTVTVLIEGFSNRRASSKEFTPALFKSVPLMTSMGTENLSNGGVRSRDDNLIQVYLGGRGAGIECRFCCC
ncbi:MAG: hypothetical protein ACLUDU_03630 [Butyricimonas faecihominis]